jgi:hypothetical protein
MTDDKSKTAGRKRYTTVGPYVTYTTGGLQGPVTIGVLAGTPVPEDVSQEQIDHLLSVGLIAEDADAEDALVTHEGEQVGQFTQRVPNAPALGGAPVATQRPTGKASKGEWKAYAVSQGMTEADAEGKTRDELAAQYSV